MYRWGKGSNARTKSLHQALTFDSSIFPCPAHWPELLTRTSACPKLSKPFDVRLGSCVDADNENVAFAVYLENLGFGNLELCDTAAGKDKILRRGFRER